MPAPTHSQHLIRTPSLRTKQVIDTTQFGRMFQLFRLLSVPNILLILRVLLIERSVLLLSTQLSILTNTAESLKELLWGREKALSRRQPFVWSYTYCPVLPSEMKRFIYSPMPYLMGVSSKIM